MTDPFTRLRRVTPAVAPDPQFAAALRTRLARALALPPGVVMTTDPTETIAAAAGPEEPAPSLGAAIPYIAVRDARAAIDWYVDVLGLQLAGAPIVMPDGSIGHAELRRGGGALYLADEAPELGVTAPEPRRSAVSLMLAVDDADATRAAALAAGGTSVRDPYDGYGHRNAWIVDPFGHRWGLNSPLAAPAVHQPGHGDIVYASLQVADADRAAAFYSAVLGWTPQGGAGRYLVEGSPRVGIVADPARRTLFCCYAVADLDAAVERVRAAGGHSEGPTDQPHGRVADCTHAGGAPFALYQLDPDYTAVGGPGGLAYVTHLTTDAQSFRDFFGAVLGWTFTPGHAEDGWNLASGTPGGGVAGGQPEPRAEAMWSVPDIDAAVERVRAAGGTASDPEQMPYGRSAKCVDDQGTQFWLGQL